VFTRHVNKVNDAKMMSVWWKDLLAPGSPLSQISNTLDATGCQVFEKHQYDAFYETEMESYLRGEGVGQLLITGVMAHLCCETTARSAFMRGFEVLFAIDGTATYSEAFHRASLLSLSHGFALPVLVDEILDGMQL
jgi:bifunctional isochorismate lyase/aryl carrier protein